MSANERGNAILAGLGEPELARLRAGGQIITLERSTLIAEAGEKPDHVYFPLEGVLSLMGTTASGGTVEVAVVGSEGVAGVWAILGNHGLPFRIVTQVPGRALRVPTTLVSEVAADCGELHNRILDYTHHLITQVAQSAICNRFHSARQRLARWLMLIADRANSTSLPLTHEFISYMVGGPRSAVSEAASDLRQLGAIDYRRGLIVVRDADRLREQACECYEVLHTDLRPALSGA